MTITVSRRSGLGGSIAETKVLDTPELIRLNKQAIKNGYNRALRSSFNEAVDPNGKHVVAMTYPHHPGMRLLILAKMKGSMEPNMVWLDMTMKNYLSISTVANDRDETGGNEHEEGPVPGHGVRTGLWGRAAGGV